MVYWSHTSFFPGKENKQIVRVPLFVLPHAFLRVFYFKCRWKGDVLEAHFNSTLPFAFAKSHSKNLVVSLQEMFNFFRSAFPQTVTEGKRKQQQKHVLDCFDMFWPSTPKGVIIFSGGQHGKLSLSLRFACRKSGAEIYLFSRRFRVFFLNRRSLGFLDCFTGQSPGIGRNERSWPFLSWWLRPCEGAGQVQARARAP